MVERIRNHIRKLGRASWWRWMFGALLIGIGLYVFNRSQNSGERAIMANAEAERSTRSKTAFEPTDWNVAPIAAIYVGVLLLLVISSFAMVIAYPRSLPDVSRVLHINPPGPRLQTDEAADLRRFRAGEEKRLNGYYWIDKDKGVVHIPIGEAMQKLVQGGINGFPKAQQ